jgi:hypothetical protein
MQKGLIRKGLVFSIIVLFISVGVQPIFADESITTTQDIEENSEYPYIEFFSICLIAGNYKTKASNDEYKLILDSGYDNKTMKVEGITFYYYAAKVPSFGYDKVQVWKIEATWFLGISLNGFVFGIGTGVRVEPMPYAPD